MSIELTMPRLSDTMESGTVIKWNVSEGDQVNSGDVIADIETDKATMEMQIYDDGTIGKILVPEGQAVNVGTAIAVLLEEDEEPGDQPAEVPAQHDAESSPVEPVNHESTPAEPIVEGVVDPEPVRPISSPPPRQEGQQRVRISPVARRLADEHGIDLAQVAGSGPSGRIIKRDVLAAIENTQSMAAASETIEPGVPLDLDVPASTGESTQLATTSQGGFEIPMTSMRQTIAKRLVQSKSTIPHYQVTYKFNMDALVALRSQLNAELASQEVKLSVNDFIVRACALAMRDNPFFNASWAEDRILVHGHVNIGVAVSLPDEKGGGLVVATIRDADLKSLRQLSAETSELAGLARTRGLSIEQMSNSTFTISNLGMFGVDNFTAIINPPNSAILACGAAVEQPVVRNHELVVGHEMSATLSLDHRVIDGAMAARFLSSVKEMIENPMTLLV